LINMKVFIPFTFMTFFQCILNASRPLSTIGSAAFLNGQAKIHTRCHPQQYNTLRSNTIGLYQKYYKSKPFLTYTARFSTETNETESSQSETQSETPSEQITNNNDDVVVTQEEVVVPIHLAEGLFAAYKPIGWTSQDVVACIRGMLERDARSRGAVLAKRRSRKSKKKIKVGHGGTLDPLATGVLVIGIGSGTKDLQKYLTGTKRYRAGVELGFETETLDMEGNRTKEMDYTHVTEENIRDVIPDFMGKIMQIPPIFSAIRKNGKRLYESAREGKTVDDIVIEAREVEIYDLQYLSEDDNGKTLPCFGLDVESGGGTYIRSLVRDMGASLGTCATMTSLERTQQGRFTLDDVVRRDEWSPESVYAAVERWNSVLADVDDGLLRGESSEVEEQQVENK